MSTSSASMGLLFCDGGGALVGAREPLPEDPTEVYRDRYLEIHGCNHLRCEACGAEVRQRPGLGQVPEFTPAPVAADIFGASNWSAIPGIVPVDDSRLYACRCAWWTENYLRGLDALRSDADFGAPPWTCAGHPRPKLPFQVDGVEVGDDTDIRALVDRALKREIPASKEATLDAEAREHFRAGRHAKAIECVDAASAEKNRRLRVERWLIRLYLRIEMSVNGSALLAPLTAAVIDHLSDPDPSARSYSIQFLVGLEEASGRDVLVDYFEGDRKLFRGVIDPRSLKEGGTLEELLVFAVSVLSHTSMRARDAARAALLGGEKIEPDRLVLGLLTSDSKWVIDHAEQIVRRTPRLIEQFLLLARERADLGDVAVRIVRLPWIDRDHWREFVAKKFPKGMPLGERIRAALDQGEAG